MNENNNITPEEAIAKICRAIDDYFMISEKPIRISFNDKETMVVTKDDFGRIDIL